MLNSLLLISVTPILIIALYVYVRDKYEKEPFLELLKALFAGILIILPVVYIEKYLLFFSVQFEGLSHAAYHAFIVASLPEEGFKYLVFIIIFLSNKNFNEKFDGIVYAVFISLGFAAIENILYVFRGGVSTGVFRAMIAVPAHAFFGIVMGYYLGLARFCPDLKYRYLALALVMPFIWHGLYDFILFSENQILLLFFIPIIVFFWVNGLRKMKKLSEASVFRYNAKVQSDNSENIDRN